MIDHLNENITEYKSKKIKSFYQPKSLFELQKIIQKANDNSEQLYFYSQGKNWGLGSKQPVVDNSSIVSLSNMNKIIDANDKLRYAIIEPGVTQKQLSLFLKKHFPELKFPVTGSAEDTSVIGNLLERGASAFSHRHDNIIALEILLADGRIIRTGFWHYFDKKNPLAFFLSSWSWP